MENLEHEINSEKEPNKRVRNFFEMNAEDEAELKKRIEEFGGLVRVFVHPDFEYYSEMNITKERDDNSSENLKKAEKAFQRIVSSEPAKTPPLFVFEGGRNMEDFEKKEERLNEMAENDIYVIRTEMASPSPLYPGREEGYEWNIFVPREIMEERGDMWDWLSSEFERLGIKKILMGGLEFYFDNDEDSYGGCLGRTMRELEDKFEIELSALTWPSKREDVRSQ